MCEICEIINGKKKVRKVFQDKHCLAYLEEPASAVGHITLTTLKHYPIAENIPDELFRHLFIIANKLAITTFEALDAKGYNILVNNGIAAGQNLPHTTINIVPRRDNDNLNFDWQPKQLSQEELSTIELKIKDAGNEQAQPVSSGENSPQGTVTELPPETMDDDDNDEENYLFKQIERIP